MSAMRLPLLCAFAAFAGGCLSSAVLLGIWHPESGASAPAQKPRAHESALVVASAAERPRAITDDPARPPTSPPLNAAPTTSETEAAVPAVAGSAVSDVLMDLEAAYRRRLATAAPAEAPASEPAPTTVAIAPAEPPPPAPALAPVATLAIAPPAVAAAPALPKAPPAAPPLAPDEAPPPNAAAPALVAQADTRPPDVHIGDVNNTYITNVRQGDVYLMQQQIAMMQYMQFMGAAAPYAANAPYAGRANGGAAHARGATSQFRQFPSTLTNLDNPWGFDLAPPHLVH